MHTPIRLTLSLVTIILLVLLTGCGGGGASSSSPSSSGDGAPLPAKTLSWAAPDSFTDSTPLDPLTDLGRYEIFVKESGSFTDADSPSAVVSAVDPVAGTLTTSFNLASLGPYLSKGITYQVSMRAVDSAGTKSDFSSPASFSF
jgi:hypothetical protein